MVSPKSSTEHKPVNKCWWNSQITRISAQRLSFRLHWVQNLVIQNCIIFIIKQCSSFTLVNLRSRGGPSAPPSIIPSWHVVLTEKCERIEDTRDGIEGRERDRRCSGMLLVSFVFVLEELQPYSTALQSTMQMFVPLGGSYRQFRWWWRLIPAKARS